MPNLAIRNVSDQALSQFREGASLRNITQAAYFEALLELHDQLRRIEERKGFRVNGERRLDSVEDLTALLSSLGLQTITRSG